MWSRPCRQRNRLGFPVVLKPVCRALVHKSDIGAVRLNIADATSLRHAWTDVMGAVSTAFPDATIEAGLVQRMHHGDLELIIGVRRDPQFGPVLVVGAGGTLAELLDEVTVTPAPVDRTRVMEMLKGMKIWPLLDGWRGRPRLDVTAVADAASRLSWLAYDLGERLVDLELNPLLVRHDSDGVVAVDARATLSSE